MYLYRVTVARGLSISVLSLFNESVIYREDAKAQSTAKEMYLYGVTVARGLSISVLSLFNESVISREGAKYR
jgi:hypothetical protein